MVSFTGDYRYTVMSNIVFIPFQPGHLAIPEAYTRSPDLLSHRTDLTIQDVVTPFLYFKFICHCSVSERLPLH